MQKTPNQQWGEEISQYRKKCQKVLTISQSIRYVGLINPYGRTLTGVVRPGTNILLKSDAARNEFFLVSTLFNMRNKTSSSIGNMDYAIFKHAKITLIVFQSKEGIYYISASKNMTPDTVAKLITKIKKVI
ncbi:MAG: hypothetical protein ACREA3_01705 [Nitrosotalea sp.]